MDCPVCYQPLGDNDYKIKCGHIFHRECLLQSVKIEKKRSCPYCRDSFNPIICLPDEEFIKGIHKVVSANTKDSNLDGCKAILKSGGRKGEQCGCNRLTLSPYCKRHTIKNT